MAQSWERASHHPAAKAAAATPTKRSGSTWTKFRRKVPRAQALLPRITRITRKKEELFGVLRVLRGPLTKAAGASGRSLGEGAAGSSPFAADHADHAEKGGVVRRTPRTPRPLTKAAGASGRSLGEGAAGSSGIRGIRFPRTPPRITRITRNSVPCTPVIRRTPRTPRTPRPYLRGRTSAAVLRGPA